MQIIQTVYFISIISEIFFIRKIFIVVRTDHYLSIYWNHINNQEVIESFLNIEKDSYNTIELFNVGKASDDNLNTLSNILKNVAKNDSERFRNILIYGLERESKEIQFLILF